MAPSKEPDQGPTLGEHTPEPVWFRILLGVRQAVAVRLEPDGTLVTNDLEAPARLVPVQSAATSASVACMLAFVTILK
jgi:hypothetical protein